MAQVPRDRRPGAPKPPAKPKMETIPRDLIDETLAILLQHAAAQVYPLLKRWESALPGVFVTRSDSQQQ